MQREKKRRFGVNAIISNVLFDCPSRAILQEPELLGHCHWTVSAIDTWCQIMVDPSQAGNAVGAVAATSTGPLAKPPSLLPNTEDGGYSREKWTTWKKRWESFAVIAGLSSKTPEYQVACLTVCFNEDTLAVVENLPNSDASEKKDVNKILEYLENHLVGQVNEIYESYRFFSRQQEEFESISSYVAAVRTLAGTCNFGNLRERLIRDRIVCGIRNKALQKALLTEPKLLGSAGL